MRTPTWRLASALVITVLGLWRGVARAWTWEAQPTSFGIGGHEEQIVSDADGNALLVWSDGQGIWGARYDLGAGWLPAFRILEGYGAYSGTAFDSAMNARGEYAVAALVAPAGGGAHAVQARVRLGVGATTGTLANGLDASDEVRVAVGKNGQVLVVWTQPPQAADSAYELHGRLMGGGVWGEEMTLAIEPTGSRPASLDAAADEAGGFLVAWISGDAAGGREVHTARYGAGSWAAPEVIGRSEGAGVEANPRVAMWGEGRTLVAWEHVFADRRGIQARLSDGTAWQPAQAVDGGAASGHVSREPHVVVQPDGVGFVAFSQGEGSSLQVFASRLGASGWEKPQEVGCGKMAIPLDVSADGYGNAAVALGSTDGITFHAYMSGLGWRGCSAQLASSFWADGILTHGHKVALGRNELLGVWHASEPAGPVVRASRAFKDVYVNAYDASASTQTVTLTLNTPENSICPSTGQPRYPGVSLSNDGVTWSSQEPAAGAPTFQQTRFWNLDATPSPVAQSRYVFVRYHASCTSPVTHDEIWLQLPPMPDLAVTAVSFAPPAAAPGSTIEGRDTVVNLGSADADSVHIDYYLSTDLIQDYFDRWLGSRVASYLAPGASDAAPPTILQLHANINPGEYHVIACARWSGPDGDRTNDCRATDVRLVVAAGPPKPDLVLSFLRVRQVLLAQRRARVEDTVRNVGQARADASTTRFFLAPQDPREPHGWIPLDGARAVGELAPRARSAGATWVTWPSILPPGRYRLQACADADRVVAESREDDNCLAGGAFKVPYRGAPR